MDFSNIKIKAIIKQRALNISFIILIKKINKLIKSLLNGKALGLDGISNKGFKVIALIIIKDLAKMASYCFINNNKFNLPPVLVPLIGPCRLIPSIGKTLT